MQQQSDCWLFRQKPWKPQDSAMTCLNCWKEKTTQGLCISPRSFSYGGKRKTFRKNQQAWARTSCEQRHVEHESTFLGEKGSVPRWKHRTSGGTSRPAQNGVEWRQDGFLCAAPTITTSSQLYAINRGDITQHPHVWAASTQTAERLLHHRLGGQRAMSGLQSLTKSEQWEDRAGKHD